MEYYKKFEGKAKFMKNLCILALVLLTGRFLLALGLAGYELSPLALDDQHTVTILGDSTKFVNETRAPLYSQLGANIINPIDTFPRSLPHTFAGIYIIGSLIQIPVIYIFWLAFGIFKDLVVSRTPFVDMIYSRIRKIGTICIWYGLLSSLVFSILLQVFVVGATGFTNPVNLYTILIGVILLIVSEILEYGHKLQNEVDETL